MRRALDDTIARGEPITPADRAAVDQALRDALATVWGHSANSAARQ
jgi:hypothetical protein